MFKIQKMVLNFILSIVFGKPERHDSGNYEEMTPEQTGLQQRTCQQTSHPATLAVSNRLEQRNISKQLFIILFCLCVTVIVIINITVDVACLKNVLTIGSISLCGCVVTMVKNPAAIPRRHLSASAKSSTSTHRQHDNGKLIP